MDHRERTKWLIPVILAAALAFYLFVAWVVPYCSTDDFQWGMEQGVRWWRYGLLNGRYAGNLCAVLMCHFEAVKVLLMGGCMFAIPLLMAVLMCRGDRKKFLPLFLFSNALILFMPGILWCELYGWVSGFGNYGVSAAVFLGFLLLVRRTYDKRDRLRLRALALFLTALVMGLFVETLSILFVGAALVLGVYACVWDKELRLPYWAAFAGAVLAAALMFSNGVLSELLGRGSALNGLRNLTFPAGSGPLTMAVSILKWYLHRLLPIAFLRGAHMAVPMAVIIGFGFWNSRFRPLCVLAAAPLGAYWLIHTTEDYLTWHHSLAGCLCWALALLAVLACRCGVELKVRRVLLFLVAPLALLPLAATTTLGHRFYFLPMVALIMLAADLASPLLTHRAGTCAAGAAMAALALLWSYRGAVTAGCNLLRAELTRQAEETLILPTDRYGGIMWLLRDPPSAEYAVYFRQFYGIPDGVTLIFLPGATYETWPEYTQAQWEARWEFPPYEGEFKSSLP